MACFKFLIDWLIDWLTDPSMDHVFETVYWVLASIRNSWLTITVSTNWVKKWAVHSIAVAFAIQKYYQQTSLTYNNTTSSPNELCIPSASSLIVSSSRSMFWIRRAISCASSWKASTHNQYTTFISNNHTHAHSFSAQLAQDADVTPGLVGLLK